MLLRAFLVIGHAGLEELDAEVRVEWRQDYYLDGEPGDGWARLHVLHGHTLALYQAQARDERDTPRLRGRICRRPAWRHCPENQEYAVLLVDVGREQKPCAGYGAACEFVCDPWPMTMHNHAV
jgi:hypothetical protein